MKLLLKWLLGIGAGLVTLVGVVWGVGMLLPEEHVASVSRTVAGTPQEVWEVMTTIREFPDWRPGVESVQRLDDRAGMPVWRESGPTGAMTLEVVSWSPHRSFRARIADEGLPFGGTWTYELTPRGPRTTVTLTEEGEVYNPFFRFMSRFVFGHESTMEAYLDGLEARMNRATPGPAGEAG